MPASWPLIQPAHISNLRRTYLDAFSTKMEVFMRNDNWNYDQINFHVCLHTVKKRLCKHSGIGILTLLPSNVEIASSDCSGDAILHCPHSILREILSCLNRAIALAGLELMFGDYRTSSLHGSKGRGRTQETYCAA